MHMNNIHVGVNIDSFEYTGVTFYVTWRGCVDRCPAHHCKAVQFDPFTTWGTGNHTQVNHRVNIEQVSTADFTQVKRKNTQVVFSIFFLS